MKTPFKKNKDGITPPTDAGHCGTNKTGQTKTII